MSKLIKPDNKTQKFIEEAKENTTPKAKCGRKKGDRQKITSYATHIYSDEIELHQFVLSDLEKEFGGKSNISDYIKDLIRKEMARRKSK